MRELGLYVLAGVIYVTVGVLFPVFLVSWPVAIGYLLLSVWAVPSLLRRR